jgi:hypothetical protein
MLYLVGGAARTGKTMIALKMLRDTNTSYFFVDYFVSALDRGTPELGIEAESPNEIHARRLRPSI